MDCLYRALFTNTECITPIWEQIATTFAIAIPAGLLIFYGMLCFVGEAMKGAEDMVKTARRAYDDKRKSEE